VAALCVPLAAVQGVGEARVDKLRYHHRRQRRSISLGFFIHATEAAVPKGKAIHAIVDK
jgi:hypothetical protein